QTTTALITLITLITLTALAALTAMTAMTAISIISKLMSECYLKRYQKEQENDLFVQVID
ncbi:5807_t:CDS:2, partial [Cetraspora pellucida]